jgi:hypothetical protein
LGLFNGRNGDKSSKSSSVDGIMTIFSHDCLSSDMNDMPSCTCSPVRSKDRPSKPCRSKPSSSFSRNVRPFFFGRSFKPPPEKPPPESAVAVVSADCRPRFSLFPRRRFDDAVESIDVLEGFAATPSLGVVFFLVVPSG